VAPGRGVILSFLEKGGGVYSRIAGMLRSGKGKRERRRGKKFHSLEGAGAGGGRGVETLSFFREKKEKRVEPRFSSDGGRRGAGSANLDLAMDRVAEGKRGDLIQKTLSPI